MISSAGIGILIFSLYFCVKCLMMRRRTKPIKPIRNET